jgi:hypothetical protein
VPPGRPRTRALDRPPVQGTVGTVVAPTAQGRQPWWEALRVGAGHGILRVGAPQVGRDRLGLAHLGDQRVVRVGVRDHRAGRHVVQLHPHAAPPEHLPHRRGIQGQRQRGAGILVGERASAGLVVDDDELAAAVIEPVDPPEEGQLLGLEGGGALDADGHPRGIDPAQVCRDLLAHPLPPYLALPLVAEPQADPALSHEPAAGLRGAWGGIPPVAQRVVRAHPDRRVRALRPGWGPRPVEVGEPIPTRAVQPGQQAGRARGIQGGGHAREGALLPRPRSAAHGRTTAEPAPSDSIAASTSGWVSSAPIRTGFPVP